MPLQFAFSTVATPDWTLDKVLDHAAQWGYSAVELRTLGPAGGSLTCDPALSKPEKVAAQFKAAGIQPLCLSTSLALHHRDSTSVQRTRFAAIHAIEDAATIGCRFIRLYGNEVMPGEARRAVLQRIAANLEPLTDKASETGVQILLENAGSFAVAKEWWWLLDLINHPMVGLSWNIANSAAIDANDQGGSVSVPMLNHRIRLAKVKDTRIGEGTGYVPLGEGSVGIETFIKRLHGIGFDGFVSVEWDRFWLPTLAPAEEYLPDALARLKAWCEQIAEAEEKWRVAREKAAAKNAPKPKKPNAAVKEPVKAG